MPPVLALIPLIASVVLAAAGASALISAIVMAVVTIAVMVATKLLTKKPKGNRINQGADLQTKINPSLPRTVLVGQTAIGPSVHFVYTYTDDSTKPNRYLLRVMQLSDQPINSLLAVYEGNNTLTFAGDITTGWYACNQHLKADGTPSMWARVYEGVFSGAVADSTLISVTGGVWTSAHKGTGLSYAIVKYDYDADAFPSGEPELVFAVQGAAVYDDRADSTVSGGSGSQRLASPSTWQYNDNTSLVIAQYLRGFTINGVRITGVGAEPKDLLPAMLFSAYNTCDQSVTYSGGTEKRYVCGMNLSSDSTAEDDLTDLALAMDGKVFDRGGSITIWPGAVRTPILDVQMKDIDWTAEKSWQPKASLAQIVNCVQGNFVDKDNFYQERDLPVRSNATWEANDGGQRFAQFISLKAVNRWSQAQRITHRIFQSSRFNGIMAVVGGLWLMEMECGDWYTATIPRWNFTSKYFEVEELTLTSDMRIALIGTEVSTTLDDWAYASNEFTRSDTYWHAPPYNLVVPTFTLAPYSFYDSLSGVQDFGFEFTLTGPRGSSGTYGEGVEVQFAITGALTHTWSGGTMTLDQINRTQTGLKPNTSYSVRARTTGGKRYSAWSSWQVIVTDTANTAFASALAGIASDDILSLPDKRTLMAVYNDLENRYQAILARAGSIGASTTALTTAYNNWHTYLASQLPEWNDETQITNLYVNAVFPSKLFPTGWTGTSVTATPSGIWTNLSEATGTVAANESRSIACLGSTQYSAGVLIKKDATGQVTRNVVVTLATTGGTAKTAFLAVDTQTGAKAANATCTDSGVSDLGDSWFVWLTFTTNVGNTQITMSMYPAGSRNLSLTLDNLPTGNVSFRRPLLAQGDITDLGGLAMIARETDLVNRIEALWQTVSTTDGATSVIINPPPTLTIHADSTGAIKSGELPATLPLSASIGLNAITTLGVWSVSSGIGYTATIGAATGILSVTAFSTTQATIPVQFVYAGITRSATVAVTVVNDPPTSSGTGSGTSGGTGGSSATLPNTTGVAYDTTNAVSATITVMAGGSGAVACKAFVNYKTVSAQDVADVWGKWQWRLSGGTWADVATEVEDGYEPGQDVIDSSGGFIYSPGNLTVNQTKTGLTNGSNYDFRFLWRDDGTLRCRATTANLSAGAT